ncbi:MAG: aminoacyl-histidine dipeptidase [Ignavibacteria bacterium]|jgi:dipeptidase D|nr:aminoacyl-histidine dipeptidase [Ignavibacteria bacterium]MCU7501706.1 aminoacyl-histidine dipeptidase [Ignavibacteria bacterium]MCU7516887.1 aminoacyl-histidine dipeptidase [Ignavibacteria bacterium]
MGKVLGSLKPELLWNHFEEICNHPHPSRKEEKLAEYIVSVGKRNNLETLRDEFGNVLIRKPATRGQEHLKTAVLQGHLDMVPEKNNDVKHDFEKDPIEPFIEGEWVKAKGTTLGSDNGIGVAAALAVMESDELEHGALEFLFTLDEETGLNGASSLKPGWLKATVLLNLDSEEDGALYIGCAGGKNTFARFTFSRENVPSDSVAYEINLRGLRGGHSGLDIAEGRGNAVKLLARLLWNLSNKFDARLSLINSGSKHNAIPREGFATFTISSSMSSEVEKFVSQFNDTVKKELATNEPGLKVTATKAGMPKGVMDKKTQNDLLCALYAAPHGVITMSPDIKGLVETSTNLAIVATEDSTVSITTSQRSSVESEKDDAADMVESLFALAGAEVTHGDGYPGWKPDVKSPILKVVKSSYEKLFNAEPEVKAIHAGLECGIINERYPEMDMISFGPTIVGAHSPDERVKIDTVQKFWDLIKEVLKNIPEK